LRTNRRTQDVAAEMERLAAEDKRRATRSRYWGALSGASSSGVEGEEDEREAKEVEWNVEADEEEGALEPWRLSEVEEARLRKQYGAFLKGIRMDPRKVWQFGSNKKRI
jgi:hypothetical protein